VFPIHIEAVGHRSERIKGNPQRQRVQSKNDREEDQKDERIERHRLQDSDFGRHVPRMMPRGCVDNQRAQFA